MFNRREYKRKHVGSGEAQMLTGTKDSGLTAGETALLTTTKRKKMQ